MAYAAYGWVTFLQKMPLTIIDWEPGHWPVQEGYKGEGI